MTFLTDKEIDKAYEYFIHLQSGEGAFKYNEKDAFRTAIKKIDCHKALLAKLDEDTKLICKRIKENPRREWNWMRKSKKANNG